MPPAERRLAWAWVALVLLGLGVLAAVAVPWDWLPGGELPPVDSTAGLPAETLAAIDSYRSRAVPLGLGATVVSLALALGLALTPWGARLVRALPGRRWWPVHLLVAVLALVVAGRLVTLPFSVAAEAARRDAGLSTLSWPGWVLDVGRGVLVETVGSALLLVAIVGVARWGRRGWWLVVSVLSGLLVVAGSFAYPLLVEPVFNEFTPMPDSPLRSSLVALAAEDGIQVDEVLVADASRRTTSVNAYVSGLGPTRRLVVYDTLLDQAPPEQVRLIMAHELGHEVNDDVWLGTSLGVLGSAAGVTALVLVAGTGWVRRRAGIDGLGDVAAVPFVLGLSAAALLLALPVQSVVSRAIEARADVHSLELTRDADTFTAMQRRLATANLSDPDPATPLYLWFASHPTTSQRMALAMGWVNID